MSIAAEAFNHMLKYEREAERGRIVKMLREPSDDLVEFVARRLASSDAKSQWLSDGRYVLDLVWKVSKPDALKALSGVADYIEKVKP